MRYLGGVLSALLLPASLLLGAPAARAQIGPDQAQALTTQLRDWLRGLAGPAAPIPDLRATAEGDHYLLTVPFAALSGPETAITAKLRPLPAGRWAADDIRLPADTTLTTKVPAKPPSTVPTDLHVHVAIAGQTSHGEIDPAMATPSSVVMGLRGVAIDTDGAGRKQSQHFDSYDQTLTLKPAAAGKLDIDEDGAAQVWESAEALPDGRAIAVGAKRLSGSAHVVGLDRAQAATLGPVLNALMQAPTPERGAKLRAVITALNGLLTSVKFEETIEGMQVAVAGQGNAVIDRLHFGFDTAAPDGNLATSLTFGMDGLAVPAMSPTAASLAPKHLTVGVSAKGIPAKAANDLMQAATEPGADSSTLAAKIDALFADPGKTGGPRLGIDTLGFDIGPALVEGHGSVVALSQSDVRGTARIAVTGFDALTDKMREDPQLQQALPFLILARGMSRSEGNTLIWDIVFTPNSLTVNGVDPRTLLQTPKRPKQQP